MEKVERKKRKYDKMLLIFTLSLFSLGASQTVAADNLLTERKENQKVGKTTIKKDVEDKQILEKEFSADLIKWHVTVNFGYPLSSEESIKIVDQVDERLRIEQVEINDEKGQSVKANGKLAIRKNKISFELDKKEDSYSYLENKSYKMMILTKIK